MALLANKLIGPAVGKASRTVYVLHGLLGSARNWQSFVSNLSRDLPSTQFVCLDLRNHGNSKGFAAPHTLDACVDDLTRFAEQTSLWPSAVVGHSMGGKVLLQLASRKDATELFLSRSPTAKQLGVYVIDSLPGVKQAHHTTAADSVARVLQLVHDAPFPIPSRQWVLDAAAKEGLEKGLAMWLASNVTHADGKAQGAAGFHWSFDPATAASLYADYLERDCWGVIQSGGPVGLDLHMIIASRSSRWHDADSTARIATATKSAHSRDVTARGDVAFTQVEAGHWVHTDNPKALHSLLLNGLSER